jgi:hypothetical protein
MHYLLSIAAVLCLAAILSLMTANDRFTEQLTDSSSPPSTPAQRASTGPAAKSTQLATPLRRSSTGPASNVEPGPFASGPPTRYAAGSIGLATATWNGGPLSRSASGPAAKEISVSLSGPPTRSALGPASKVDTAWQGGPQRRWANGGDL